MKQIWQGFLKMFNWWAVLALGLLVLLVYLLKLGVI